MRSLDLVITPDTGPMHLAAWVGAPTLNLSMGPVNAFETAPAPPGHAVLRPTDSCAGCWRCIRSGAVCRQRFRPETVASLAARLVENPAGEMPGKAPNAAATPARPAFRRPPGLRLDRTARDRRGLFTLEPADALRAGGPAAGAGRPLPASHREQLALFWQEWFLAALGGAPHQADQALARLAATAPHLAALLRRNAGRLTAGLAAGLHRQTLAAQFWSGLPPLIRPLSGYLQLLLENGDFSPTAWARALELAEDFAGRMERID